jgi:hypothetical protein
MSLRSRWLQPATLYVRTHIPWIDLIVGQGVVQSRKRKSGYQADFAGASAALPIVDPRPAKDDARDFKRSRRASGNRQGEGA